ncbi:MAG: hypothetical protein M1823_008983, partial [Watsoniomyces obsoletus]
MGDDPSQHALTLLRLLCFYHHEQVPVQMFYRAWQNSQGQVNQLESLLWLGTGSEFPDFRRAVQAAIALLVSFSLVTLDTDASVSIHPLVHEWCRERLAPNEGEA